MGERASAVPQLLGAAVGIVVGSALLFALLGALRDAPGTPEVADLPIEQTDDTVAEPVDESPAPEPSESVAADPSEQPTDEPTEEPTFEAVDPGSVSIQVLDAVDGGDGSAAQAVADELEAAGYNVVVVNQAGRFYQQTTVFWSDGEDDAGRQVAAELGVTQAEQTPAEVQLSDSVSVHVVVGADRV